MSGNGSLLIWRKPALLWSLLGIVFGSALIASPVVLFAAWLPLADNAGSGLILILFGLLWLGLGAALCGLKIRGRSGLTRGDVIVCFPLAALFLIALILVVGAVNALDPLRPLLWFLSPVVAVAGAGGVLVMMWGLPFCAAAAWLFSYIAFRKV